MSGPTIEVNPVPGALGAEIGGIDLRSPPAPEAIAVIRQAFLDHHVVFFRSQTLSPDEQTAFGRHFGELEDYPFVEALLGHPKIIPVIKEADETTNFGGGWHTDLIYRPEPSAATMLYAVEVPARGGDTLFADGVLAYEALSDRMKDLVGGLHAVYNVSHVARSLRYRSNGVDGYSRSMPSKRAAEVVATSPVHPVVRTHPETGVKGLYLSREHTVNFDGMTVSESEPLLDWLQAHMTQPVFTTRFHWMAGSMAFWDNRCVSHYALNDYHGERRHMHRLTISGDTPF